MTSQNDNLFETSLEILATVDRDGNFKSINQTFSQFLGWTFSDLDGISFWEMIVPTENLNMPNLVENLSKGHPAIFVENWIKHKNGYAFLLRWTAYLEPKSQTIYLAIHKPEIQKDEQEIFKLAVESSPIVILVITDNKILYANQLVKMMFGYHQKELVGQPFDILVPERLRWVHKTHSESYSGQPYLRLMSVGKVLIGQRKDGSEFPVDIGLNPVHTHNSLIVVCSIIDMSKRREVERLLTSKIQLLESEVSTLDKLAKTDELTSLNNHRFLITQLELHITIAYKNIEPISFVMVDIDDFKKYNDSYGHLGGDEVLKLIAKLLELSVRHGEIVARYGGEEFGIILPASDAREAKNTSERLRKIIEEFECPFQRITVSLGCATVFPVLSQSVSINEVHDLIEMADKALYHSKSKGKNTVTHFDEIRLSNI